MSLQRLLAIAAALALVVWMVFRSTHDMPTQVMSNGRAGEHQTCPMLPEFLPPEAHRTLRLIAESGPFPHKQDGVVFGNREGLLPREPQGYYHEYTVETPGSRDRGARRIITAGTPPTVYYYTDDHYQSFRCFRSTL